ncbi:MAG: restriction endonuclease subunit S [Methanospirillum sp.]
MSERAPPEGWNRVTLADVCQKVPNVKPEDEPEREFGYVDISAISNTTFTIGEAKRFLGKDAPSRARRPIEPGDVLFSTVRTYLRNIAMVSEGLDADLCSTGFTVLRSNGAVVPQYLFHYTLSEEFINAVTPQQTGTQYPATTDRVIFSTTIPLPPLAEQRRIVARLEDLLADVERVRGRLEGVAATMQRFRRTVLEAAVEGRLTEEGRRNITKDIPEGEKFDKSFIKTKRANNEAEADFIGALEELKKPLPTIWLWKDLKNICTEITDGDHQAPPKSKSGIPFLTISNISNGELDFSRTMFVPESYYRSLPLSKKPKRNDILYSVTGSYGIAVLVDTDRPFCFQRHIALLRPSQSVSPKFLWISMKSPLVFDQATNVATGIAQLTVPLRGLRKMKIPLPPLAEQDEIVRRVDALFALANRIEGEVAGARERVEALRDAVLAKAFRGELVPTEAELARREGREYEPAGALLERVRAEREDSRQKPTGRERRQAGQTTLSGE